MTTRKPITLYVVALGAAAVAVSVFWATSESDWLALREHLLTRAVGWCAAAALLLTLSITPLGRLAMERARLSRLRRALGISTALLASLHALIALDGPLDGAWSAALTWPYLRAGLVALLILLALLVTSFPRLTRALRVRVWKPLHRLSYAAAALVALHLYLGPFAPRRAVAAFAALVAVVLLARLVPRKRNRTPSTRAPR